MQTSIGKLPPDVLHQRCQALGGTQVLSNADYCCELPFLPMYPVLLQIWFADEEFAPSDACCWTAAPAITSPSKMLWL